MTDEEWDRRSVYMTDEWEEEYKQFEKSIPKISDEVLAERYPRIQPIVKGHYIKPVDPSNIVFTWDPELTEEAEGLTEIHRQRVFVAWAYYGLFKPSIRECLAQMPEDIVQRCRAFQIVKSPETASDFHCDRETSLAFDAGFHTCVVAYYE